jgi:NAD(P)-dependent dehydrogenase (short-subunit alcohol dehydrogenase family)
MLHNNSRPDQQETDPMRQFEGKVAVVTGAASGMGRAYADRCAAEGMKVVLADISEEELDQAVRELRRQERDVIGVVTNVIELADVENLAQKTLEAYGKVNLVFNNAGVVGYLRAPLWEATDKDWQWTFGVNFWGVVHGVRSFLPIMLKQGEEGWMVNTASTMGLVFGGNMYGITKHAVVAMTERLYTELKQAQPDEPKIGISLLCPGMVNTRIFSTDRVRPAALRNAGETFEYAGPDVSNAMPPSQVADIVFQAIRDEQFYIFTDHEWDQRMETRWQNIRHRTNPPILPRFSQQLR